MFLKSSRRETGIFLFLVFLLTGCDLPEQVNASFPFLYSGATMGTSFSIKVSQLPESVQKEVLKQRIDDLLEQVNDQMSTYLPQSELSRLNKAEAGKWIVVSEHLFAVLKKAKEINRLSGGAFDITVAPLVNLWGFGPGPMKFRSPTADQIESKMKRTGSELFELNVETLTVRKKIDELHLDLSALAKGYAVDLVASVLDDYAIDRYMVEIGGEIRLKGTNLEDKAWRIAIEKPTADMRMIQKVLPVTDVSMATSGDYRNFFEENGVRYSHTIDPRTGRPITHKLASVTVLSEHCMNADAWATALTVLGPDEGFKLAEEQNIAALLIIKTTEGFVEQSTTVYQKHFEVKL
jgi:FAD:protein FMN transferase